MFSLKDFIKKGLISAIGNLMDYQIILNAAGWLEKGILTEQDLSDIEIAIEEYKIQQEELQNSEEDIIIPEEDIIISEE